MVYVDGSCCLNVNYEHFEMSNTQITVPATPPPALPNNSNLQPMASPMMVAVFLLLGILRAIPPNLDKVPAILHELPPILHKVLLMMLVWKKQPKTPDKK